MQKIAPADWMRVTAASLTIELWECGRAINQRDRLLVYLSGGRRYRSDRRQKTSAAQLKSEGWKLYARV